MRNLINHSSPLNVRVAFTHSGELRVLGQHRKLIFAGSDAVYLREGGGHVKAVSGRCLTGDIWTQQLTVAIPNDFALCLPGAGAQDLFPDADTRSPFCAKRASIVVVLKVTSTEELRIGKILGRRILAALELPLAQYVATERVLSPGRP